MNEALLFMGALGVFFLLLVGVSKDGPGKPSDLGLLAYREERGDPPAGRSGTGKGKGRSDA